MDFIQERDIPKLLELKMILMNLKYPGEHHDHNHGHHHHHHHHDHDHDHDHGHEEAFDFDGEIVLADPLGIDTDYMKL